MWNNNLESDMILCIELLEDKGVYPVAVTAFKISNDDGSIKYGAIEYPFYSYPLKDISNPELNKTIGYSIVLMLNEPKPDIEKPADIKIPTPKEETKKPAPQEGPKPTIEKFDEVQRLPEVNKPDEFETEDPDEAFIPNTLKQYTEEKYDQNNVIVLYFDSCRYLPENITISRLGVKAYNSTGDIVMNPIDSKCILEMSTWQKPYFGIRQEISFKSNPAMDSTTLLVFRIDAIDRHQKEQVVVGYAFFPLFVDLATGLPAKKDGGEFALQNGYYQIPIFSQKPIIARPIIYENWIKLERIPWATLLLRVHSAPKDENGIPILVHTVPVEK